VVFRAQADIDQGAQAGTRDGLNVTGKRTLLNIAVDNTLDDYLLRAKSCFRGTFPMISARLRPSHGQVFGFTEPSSTASVQLINKHNFGSSARP